MSKILNQIKCQIYSIKSNVKHPQLNQMSNILNQIKCQIYSIKSNVKNT